MAWIVAIVRYQAVQLYAQVLLSASLLSDGKHYNNIEWEGFGILHSLEKFHYHCFARGVYIITDHKPLKAIIYKVVTTLSQHLQWIMLCIHQYRVCIVYKPDSDLYIVVWLTQNNHTENRDQEIISMTVNVNAINTLVNIPIYTSIEDILAVI